MKPVATPAQDEETSRPRPTEASRAIANLDALVQAMIEEVPPSKPWQRQLRVHLIQAEREVQILRMTIALDRGQGEVLQAARALQISLRTANASVSNGRADAGTKALVSIALATSQRISGALQS